MNHIRNKKGIPRESEIHAVGIRQGKWDIPANLGSGQSLGLSLAYLVIERSPGVPYTLDAAYPHLRDATVALGFPDILFHGPDAYKRCLGRMESSGADVVLVH